MTQEKSTPARLEHVNVTVSDPKKTAQMMCDIFGWHIRWEGAAIYDGLTVHVGTEDDYIAIYSKGDERRYEVERYDQLGGLNHIALVVDDLDAIEARVKKAGFIPENHRDYKPGRRFYFRDHDGIEFEVVSYE